MFNSKSLYKCLKRVIFAQENKKKDKKTLNHLLNFCRNESSLSLREICE